MINLKLDRPDVEVVLDAIDISMTWYKLDQRFQRVRKTILSQLQTVHNNVHV